MSRVVLLILTLDRYRVVNDHHNAVMAVADGVGHPNELDRPIRGCQMYLGADNCPLDRGHRRGVGGLND